MYRTPQPPMSHAGFRSAVTAALLSAILLLAVPIAVAAAALPQPAQTADASLIAQTIRQVQPKVVKVYGAGGFRGMEPYQSGMLVSSDGYILTVRSHVLDTDYISVTLDDGRRFDAKLVGADLGLEIALLKIDAVGLPCFDLAQAKDVEAGARVLAFSNLFGIATGDEPASVQHGVVSVKTTLAARQGVFETPYRGPVYVLDAVTNNPGAAGGPLVTRRGELVAMLGKELRNSLSNTWLNYAVPIAELRGAVEQMRAGAFSTGEPDARRREKPQRALDLEMLGIVLVPDVLPRTPPYVDHVRPGTPAAEAGVRSDDLIVLLGERLIQSCQGLRAELEYIDYEDPIKLTLFRGSQLVEVVLRASTDQERRRP